MNTVPNLGCAPSPSIVQVLGYSGRIWSHFDTFAIGGFVMQAILILVAPALYAASVYMILGRLVRRLRAEGLLLLPAAWVTKIFVAGDVVSFTMQAGGGGVQAAGTLELYEMGEKIIIAGLFVQIAFFGFFLAAAVLFYLRYARGLGAAASAASSSSYAALSIDSDTPKTVSWRRHLWVLFAVSALILVRSVFRVIEYLQGNKGYLIAHEVFLYIFDAVLMALVMALFLVWYVDDLDDDKDTEFSMEEAR